MLRFLIRVSNYCVHSIKSFVQIDLHDDTWPASDGLARNMGSRRPEPAVVDRRLFEWGAP
jgi:hypothetical protein